MVDFDYIMVLATIPFSGWVKLRLPVVSSEFLQLVLPGEPEAGEAV